VPFGAGFLYVKIVQNKALIFVTYSILSFGQYRCILISRGKGNNKTKTEGKTMKWTRKTEFGQFKPYVSEDGKYTVADMSMSAGRSLVPEYAELVKNNWKSSEDHNRFLKYCNDHKLKLSGANWVLVNNETGETKFPFKSAKEAKEAAENN
jgi:hypothetical protein